MSTTDVGPEDGITFILQQHQQIRDLFRSVSAAEGDKRTEAFECLLRLLAVHETAEELVTHPMARTAAGGDAVVDALLREEGESKQLLADLEEIGTASPAFEAKLAALRSAVEAHAEHEEQQELPLLRAVTDQGALERMRMRLKAAEAIAPTHPHPHGPDSALGNALVGPLVSIVDRVRDAVGR